MKIAIDDTHGPSNKTLSKYVTGNRRTHVAVFFQDHEVDYIREQVSACLNQIKVQFGVVAEEFHFVDIYNRNPPWDQLPTGINLKIFSFFSEIYSRYNWPVLIQTVDDRTLCDHKVKIPRKIPGFNLEDFSDLSLVMLLCKIKLYANKNPEPLQIYIDNGIHKAGSNRGSEIFHDYESTCSCIFEPSKNNELIQIADFIAYVINRSTHLGMKDNRTEIDNWFLQLSKKFNSPDLLKVVLPLDFDINHFDEVHRNDRKNKNLGSC